MIDSTVGGLAISVTPTRGRQFAWVCITGDVEVGSDPALARTISELQRLGCANVCVDLAGVGFAGTALLTFLVHVINTVPADASVLLCRAGRSTRRLLELSFLDTIATLRDELPVDVAVLTMDTPLVGARSGRARWWRTGASRPPALPA
jgi:ABC-type transporter Mla MlaB component